MRKTIQDKNKHGRGLGQHRKSVLGLTKRSMLHMQAALGIPSQGQVLSSTWLSRAGAVKSTVMLCS